MIRNIAARIIVVLGLGMGLTLSILTMSSHIGTGGRHTDDCSHIADDAQAQPTAPPVPGWMVGQ